MAHRTGPYTRAAIIGMSRNTGKAHIVRAGLESIAYQVNDCIELLVNESNIPIKKVNVDGEQRVTNSHAISGRYVRYRY